MISKHLSGPARPDPEVRNRGMLGSGGPKSRRTWILVDVWSQDLFQESTGMGGAPRLQRFFVLKSGASEVIAEQGCFTQSIVTVPMYDTLGADSQLLSGAM